MTKEEVGRFPEQNEGFVGQDLTTCFTRSAVKLDEERRIACVRGSNHKVKGVIMNAITRWNPFRTESWDPFKELENFEQRLASRFGRMLGKPNGEGTERFTTAEWAPVVDISEDEKEFLVKAELPGLKKDEIQVIVEAGALTISGERQTEKEEKTKKYHRVERAYGKFERSFTLPDKADPTKVMAEFKDGVLQVHLPKSEKTNGTAREVLIT